MAEIKKSKLLSKCPIYTVRTFDYWFSFHSTLPHKHITYMHMQTKHYAATQCSHTTPELMYSRMHAWLLGLTLQVMVQGSGHNKIWETKRKSVCIDVHRHTHTLSHNIKINSKFSSVQSLSRVWLFATLWIAARQASLSITSSRSSLRLTSMESVMPSSHLILFCPLLLLPPIPPSIRVFSNESTLCMRWPKSWSFSFSIILPKNTQDWFL